MENATCRRRAGLCLTSGGEIPTLWRAAKSCWGQMRGHLTESCTPVRHFLERSPQAYLSSPFPVRNYDIHMQMSALSSQRAALSHMGPDRASEQEAP